MKSVSDHSFKNTKRIKFLKYLIWFDWGLYQRFTSDNGINKNEILIIKTMIDHTMLKPCWLIACGKLSVMIGPIWNRKNFLKNA